jgi:hypothetical protein
VTEASVNSSQSDRFLLASLLVAANGKKEYLDGPENS